MWRALLASSATSSMSARAWTSPSTKYFPPATAPRGARRYEAFSSSRKRSDAIMKIDLRMLALLFTLAFNSMLQSFRKEVMFPVEGGVAMKQWADALGAVALGLDGRPVFIRKREHDLDLRSSACVPSPWTMKRPFVSSPIDLRETKLIYVKQNGFHSLEV